MSIFYDLNICYVYEYGKRAVHRISLPSESVRIVIDR